MGDNSQIVVPETTVFRVRMGSPETTDLIMAALRIHFDEWISEKNFPIKPREDMIKIIYPGCPFSEEEGLKFLAGAKLERPTYEHGIRFIWQYREATISNEKINILFLHEPWVEPFSTGRVICLHDNPDPILRGVSLYDPCDPEPNERLNRGLFGPKFALAGVLPRKQ